MKQLKRLTAILLGCVLIVGGGALAMGLAAPTAKDDQGIVISQEEYEILKKYKRLEEIYRVIEEIYLWDYDETELLQGAAQGMLGALEDDYTFYYTPERMEKENEAVVGEYGGLGIEVFPNAKDDTITIRRVFYGGPAQQAGLRVSDKIVQVEGQDMRATDINDAVEIMRGEIGGKVKLSILRDKEIFEVTLERAMVQTEIVSYRVMDDDIGYLRIYYFEGNLVGQLDEARKAFEEAGVKGLVLDLRENPGGLMDLAIRAADVFQDDAPVLHIEDKYTRKRTEYTKDGKWDIPIVVLVDENTASAAEILAVSLQENGEATVVGQQTFGKGIMQSVYPFQDDGAGMQITSDYWLSPNGNNLHGVGVTPDVVVELSEDAIDDNYDFIPEKDDQLQTAIELLLEENA